MTGFDVESVGNDVTARFTDEFIDQTAWAALTSPEVTVTFEQLPVVRVITPDPTAVNPGSSVEVVVEAVDGTGDPVVGAKLKIEKLPAGTTGASSSGPVKTSGVSCAARLRGEANAQGQVRFRVCATSSGAWRADGANLVPSRPVIIKVRTPAKVTRTKVKGTITPAAALGKSVPTGAKVVITIAVSSKKVCTVGSGRIATLKPGKCRVTIRVIPKPSKTVKKPKATKTTVTITVTP